jgi:phage shock protein E
MKLLRYALCLSCTAAAVCGCACGNTESAANSNTAPAEQAIKVDLNAAILLDVRSPEEYASGYLQGARNIPYDRIGAEIAAVAPDKSTRIILYCRSGRRANTALETLRAMGYTDVSNYGGLEDARERLGLPVITE